MKDYLFSFPEQWQFGAGSAIDDWVNQLARNHRELFTAIKETTIGAINGIESFLNAIPWWLLILLVMVAG